MPAAHPSSPANLARQCGMGMAGFLVTAMPVLWLGLGGVELAHWMQMRQGLSLVLMEAARAGATLQANPLALAAEFERSLRQVYPAPGEVAAVLQQHRTNLGEPWHIAIHLPSPQVFADFADPFLEGTRAWPGQRLVRNEGQSRQHAAAIARGWPQGRGPASGLTIFDANTLEISLYWPHRPLLPGVAALLRTLAPLAKDPRSRQWLARGYLPFRRQVSVAMQSHPAAWSTPADGRVAYTTQAAEGHAIRPGPAAGRQEPARASPPADAPRLADKAPVDAEIKAEAEAPDAMPADDQACGP